MFTIQSCLLRIESKLRRTEKKMKTRRWEENSAEYIAQLMEACEAQRKSRLVEIRDEVVQYVFLTEIRKRYSGNIYIFEQHFLGQCQNRLTTVATGCKLPPVRSQQ